jgi:hypothetical protein
MADFLLTARDRPRFQRVATTREGDVLQVGGNTFQMRFHRRRVAAHHRQAGPAANQLDLHRLAGLLVVVREILGLFSATFMIFGSSSLIWMTMPCGVFDTDRAWTDDPFASVQTAGAPIVMTATRD